MARVSVPGCVVGGIDVGTVVGGIKITSAFL